MAFSAQALARVDVVKWMTWNEAVDAVAKDKAAGRTPKLILVHIYTDWCSWCKKMETNSFNKPRVARYINEHFYPVKFDAEYKETITFEGFSFRYVPTKGRQDRGIHQLAYTLMDGDVRYPSTVFLDGEFDVLQRIGKYLDDWTLYTVLNYLNSDDYGLIPWAEYQVDFNLKNGMPAEAPEKPKPSRKCIPSVPVNALNERD
jgi:thioredoxin-related protein